MKRNEPCTPSSDHSSDCSGGAVNIMKSRAVSAPYFSTRPCGSTPLFLDFDIVPSPSYCTSVREPSSRVANQRLPAGDSSASTSTGLNQTRRPSAGCCQ